MSSVKTIDLGLTGYDELFMDDKGRAENRLPKIHDIPLDQIDDFPDHPFQVRLDEDMDALVQSVRDRGIITPVTLRQKEDGRYEIVSGHRRKKACELAGLETVKAEIKELTRDEAIILMVESNLQRSTILPSEKAFSYKMRLEAMKRQGFRSDLTSDPLGQKFSVEKVADKSNDSKTQVQRYIRLTELVPDLLNMVDEGRIAFRPAVELSYLQPAEQEALLETMSFADATPSLAQAIKMKKFSQDGKLSPEVIESIMGEEKPNQKEKFSFRADRLRQFIPPSVPYAKTEDYVLKALEYQLVENKQKFIAQIMTSKTPLRAAEDVDETALSYSEIKALATGNPLIIEKCDLDMQVSKLNMLKANHLNQRYAMEEMVLRKYPETIKKLTERIAGYEQDVKLVAEHPKPKEGFAGMVINGTLETEKEVAGKAIIDVCTKMTGSDAVAFGSYRGFSLTVSYDASGNEYRMTMKGTLSHTVVLGADVYGNITRMDNALEALGTTLDVLRNELENTKNQLENAKEEMVAPFAREEELQEKAARLKELNILLNMDEKDKSLIDDQPEQDGNTPERKKEEPER